MLNNFRYALLISLIFVSLVYYNFHQAQVSLKNTSQTNLSIKLDELPSNTKVNQSLKISWYVEAPSDFETTSTTIYYGPNSSPSALVRTNAPDAVGYPFSTSDYRKGNFYLPSKFESSLLFSKPGIYYLRGYSLVRNNHLWTDEKKIIVTAK